MKPQPETVLRSGKRLTTIDNQLPTDENQPQPSQIPKPPPQPNLKSTQLQSTKLNAEEESNDEYEKSSQGQESIIMPQNMEVSSTATHKDDLRAAEPYLYKADDPDPLLKGIGKKEYSDHVRNLREYSNGMFAAYTRTKAMREALLWQDFVTAFRPHTIRSWTRPMLCEWKALLSQRGLPLDQDRNREQVETVIDLLYLNEYKQPQRKPPPEVKQKPEKSDQSEKPRDADKSNQAMRGAAKTKSSAIVGFAHGQKSATSTGSKWPGDPGDSSDTSEDESSAGGPSKKGTEKEQSIKDNNKYADEESESKASTSRPLGINGMMKAFTSMPTYSGRFTDDLEEVIQGFETIADVCDVKDDTQRLKAIPIMLKGAAFRKFSDSKKDFKTYDDAIRTLRSWFSSSEKQTRLLMEWNTMRLSEALEQQPNKAEIEVFKDFVDRATSIQQQLHASYHDDRQLRDMLLLSVDLPRIQDTLRDRQPRTTHQLVERVATKLSHKPRASSRAYLTAPQNINDDHAMYSLGQKYGGEARRNHTRHKNWRNNRHEGKYGSRRRPNGRRQTPSWMRGIKGCFVCRSLDHFANQRHTREEVTKAIKELKLKHPTALLTTEDTAYITEIFAGESTEEDAFSAADLAADSDQSDNDEADMGEIAYVATEDLLGIERELSDAAFIHGITIKNKKGHPSSHAYISSHPTTGSFKGIRIDTCCNRTSIMGQNQYDAYCRDFGVRPSVKPCGERSINGIAGGIRGTGLVLIDIPFTQLNLVVGVEFLLVSQNIPTLLSMRDMKLNGLDISLQKEIITHEGRSQQLKLENFFLKYNWSPENLAFALYTEDELRRIHRTFGHPSVGATQGLLKRAKGGHLNAETLQSITKIAEGCKLCERHKKAPRRFKLTVGMDELRFNHCVQVDTMFLDGLPVCHMVDEATHYTAATFLRSQSTRDVWKAIRNMWSLVYLGPPDHIRVDQGTNYTSREMAEACEADGIMLRQAPIETPGSIGIVERYHAPLRAAYTKIREDSPHDVTKEECLRMAVFAVNNTVGPEGLCPTLLVFGTLPRPIRTTPSATQLARARTIDDAMKLVEQVQAKRRIQFGLRHSGGPKAKEDATNLKSLPAGAKVLVYRTASDMWEGPHIFVSEEAETAVVQTGAGRKLFRSNCVKPYVPPPSSSINSWQTHDESSSHALHANDSNGKDPQKKMSSFKQTRKQEMDGLVRNGTFELTNVSQVPTGTRVFGSRFIDQLKVIGQRRKRKSRLVAQNYLDYDATELSTKAPTIQRFAQRMLISMAASSTNAKTCARDVTQAYVQSKTKLERSVFLKPPPEMGLPADVVLKVVKPLYGIPESGLHWYLTYLEHHVARLGMRQSRVDPCFLMRHDAEGKLEGAAILQVDDTLMFGTERFLNDEQIAASEFKSKIRSDLSNKEISFNGLHLRRGPDGSISTVVEDKIANLGTATTEKEFASIRAAAQYIGVTCRPEICANTQLIAPGADPISKEEFKTLSDIVTHLKNSKNRGLTFVPLDLDTVRLVIVSDASFANARGCKSQLGFIALMTDAENRTNVIHYGSSRCRRVTRSVMAAELHALILAFDYGFVIREMMRELLGRDVALEALVDSKTVFDIVAKDSNTTERRLQIDVHALRESYARGELSRLAWIPGNLNPADALTKKTSLKPTRHSTNLDKLVETNVLNVTPVGWAELQTSKN